MASAISLASLARTQRAAMLLGIRAAFGALEWVAPDVGAWWAERLWFTVPAAARRPEADVLPTGEGFEVSVNGHRVVGEAWGAGQTLVLLHGWGGKRGDFAGLVQPLVTAGHRVVAFDAPGHGQSESGPAGQRRSTILEFADSLAVVCRFQGPVEAIVAHSLGAMAAAIALRRGLVVDQLVLIAPMAKVSPYTEVFAHRVGFGDRILSRLAGRIERRVATPLAAFDVAAVGATTTTPPVLLVHDRADRETRFSDSVAIRDAWHPSTLFATSGLGHRRILFDAEVGREIVSFLAVGRPSA